MRRFRPRLLPRRIVALDKSGKTREFRLRVRPDGRAVVSPGPVRLPVASSNAGYVLVLDPALLFQRTVRGQPRSRAELVPIVQDLFPFPPETTAYALADDDKGRLGCWAAPRADLAQVTADWPNPAAILAAPPDPAAIERVVAFRLDHGAVADLLPGPVTLVGPAPVLTAGLALAALLAGLATIWGWNLYQSAQDMELRRDLAALEAEAAPVIKQREAILRMVPALKAEAAFSGNQSAGHLALLGRLISHMPAGSSIERIELKPDGLTLTGQDADPAAWLSLAGQPPADLKLEPLPKSTRFTARFNNPPAPEHSP